MTGDERMYKIYVGQNCPNCRVLKIKLKDRTDIEYADVSDPTVLADAMLDNVTTLPSLVYDGKVYVDLRDITKILMKVN
jgi:predicted thioredoxin/glutaredoxin